MSILLILLILLVLGAFGGGLYNAEYRNHGFGLGGLLILVLVVLFATGNLHLR